MKAILKKADELDIEESTLAKKILKKLTGKKSLTKFKKRSKLLKEADPTLFEINFNKKEIATGSTVTSIYDSIGKRATTKC